MILLMFVTAIVTHLINKALGAGLTPYEIATFSILVAIAYGVDTMRDGMKRRDSE